VLFGVPRITSYPFTGSAAIFYWDIGPVRPDPDNPARRSACPRRRSRNVPNREGEDPHSAPRGAPLPRS